MKYEMEDVLWMTRKELNPETLSLPGNNEDMLREKVESILRKIESDKLELKKYLRLNYSNVLSGCIPLYELDIVTCWDLYHGYMDDSNAMTAKHLNTGILFGSYILVKEALKEMLGFIHAHFIHYTNRFQKIPAELAAAYFLKMSPLVKQITTLLDHAELDGWLKQQAGKPLQELLAGKQKINYSQLSYLTCYAEMLYDHLSKPGISNYTLIEQLLIHRYNEDSFSRDLIQFHKRCAEELELEQEKLLYFRFQLKHHRQLQTLMPDRYNDLAPGAEEILIRWLEEEIQFMEKKQADLPLPIADEKPADQKIELQLSVYELALGARLLMDANLVSEKSFPAMARYLTAHFSTQGRDQLSLESFRKKSYEFERKVVNRVKDKIILLMNLVQKF